MKVYDVRIGKETKRGGFNEMYAFACNTENEDYNSVRSYWMNKYEGFDVRVSNMKVMDVEMGRTNKSKLMAEIDSLHKQLKSEPVDYYEGVLDSGDYSADLKYLVDEIKTIEKDLEVKVQNARQVARNQIESLNASICHRVQDAGGFSSTYGEYKFGFIMKGKVVRTCLSDGEV